jgi:hypothetical protein
MSQKAFVKAEKCLACDLKAGDLYVEELPDQQYFQRELNRTSGGTQVYIRTNVPTKDTKLVYRIHIEIIDPERPRPPRVYPHAPPGVKHD